MQNQLICISIVHKFIHHQRPAIGKFQQVNATRLCSQRQINRPFFNMDISHRNTTEIENRSPQFFGLTVVNDPPIPSIS